MTRRAYLIVAVIALLCGLVIYAPAATLYRWATPQNDASGIEYYGIQGTFAQGQVSAINVHGRTVLNDVQWSLKPLWLLLAQRAFRISGGGEQAAIDGTARFALTGAVTLSDVHVTMSVKNLLAAAGQAFLPFDGQVMLDIDSVKLKNGQIKSADAVAQLQGLAWTLARNPVNLGDFEAKVGTEKETVTVTVQSVAGPLEATGDIKLSPDQGYQIAMQFRPKAQADAIIRNFIASVGAPDAQGWSHYRSQGRLSP